MIHGPPSPAPLIVGQAPGANADHVLGVSGARLARLCGLTLEEYADTFARVNLLQDFPGKDGRPGTGDRWDPGGARTAWWNLVPELDGRRVIMLGRRVAGSLAGADAAPWWVWLPYEAIGRQTVLFTFAVVPHPSGISRWWQSPMGVLRAERWWRGLVREIQEA